MASAMRSLYLVRYQVPLKTRINLFKSLVLSQHTKNHCNKHFRIFENVPIIANKRTHKLFLEQKCKPKWSNGSIVLNLF